MALISGRSALLIGLSAGILSAAIFMSGSFEPLEARAYDYWLSQQPPAAMASELALFAIAGPQPTADQLAATVAALDVAGAEIIVLNDPIRSDDPGIPALADAVSAHGGVIVGARFDPAQLAQLRAGHAPAKTITSGDQIDAVALSVAFVDRFPGSDGVLRRFTPQVGAIPEIGYATAAATRTSIELPNQAPMLGDPISFGPGPRLLIPYRSIPPTQHLTVGPGELKQGKADLSGKTVIVAWGGDEWTTPLGTSSDAMVTMQIASSVLEGRGITRAPSWMVVLAVILVALSLSIGAGRPEPWIDVLMPAAVAAMIWFLAGLALRNGTWVDVVPMIFAMGSQVLILTSVRVLNTKRQADDGLHQVLTHVLMNGAIADNACLWIREEGRHVPKVTFGNVALHLVTAIPDAGISEARRDEGNVVGISLRPWADGGIVVVRPHGNPMTPKRLALLTSIVELAMRSAELPASSRIKDFLKQVAASLDETDHFLAGHNAKVAEAAVAVGRKAGLTQTQLDALEEAAHLHDLGKIGVPDRVLDSASRLTDEEYVRVKRHAELSARILSQAGMPVELIEAVRDHHERWDGKGYPNRLSGEQIPIEARVLALADAAMSLVSDRPYRRGTSVSSAITEIASQRGRMFDPKLVEALIEVAIESPHVLGASRAVV